MKDKELKNLYILSRNNILGIEEWVFLGVTTAHRDDSWDDELRVVFYTDKGAVSIPKDRMFKLERI